VSSAPKDVPAAYQIRVHGHLGLHWMAWLGDPDLTHADDGTTSLRCEVADQAQLHGLLAKVRDLGLTLISVELAA
jgi:ABC-type microcin C transport system duplicated ATPase subunit YejF